MPKTPGFKIPVPGKDELRPNMRDCDPSKGPNGYAKPVGFVMDLGAPRDSMTDWVGVRSPASATFKAGVPMGVNPSAKPGQATLPIQTGRTWPNRDKKTNPEA